MTIITITADRVGGFELEASRYLDQRRAVSNSVQRQVRREGALAQVASSRTFNAGTDPPEPITLTSIDAAQLITETIPTVIVRIDLCRDSELPEVRYAACCLTG